MTRLLLTGAAAFTLWTGVAIAQTPIAPAPLAPPPPGTLSTEVIKKAVGPDGSLGYSDSETYSKGAGVINQTTTATYPPVAAPPRQVTTTQQQSTTTVQTQ